MATLNRKREQAPALQTQLSTKSSIPQIEKKSRIKCRKIGAADKPGGETRKRRSSAFLGAGFAGKFECARGILERELRNTGAEHGFQSVLGPLQKFVGLAVALLGV